MWGGLLEFKGLVTQRYYHEVHGQPMFTVDFGGSISKWEVLVTETRTAITRGEHDGFARVLNFDFGRSSEVLSVNAVGECSTGATKEVEEDGSDGEWQATWEDFPDEAQSDDQWQEEDLTLTGDRVFTGPQPRPTTFRAILGQPIENFKEYGLQRQWPELFEKQTGKIGKFD